ncbi:MAG: ABC transporter ATP-binding protein [Acidobacteriota bacterium]
MRADEAAISIADLSFAYRKGEPVLHIEALTVERGEKVFLFGPSGSGKTTLLGLIAGVLEPTEGTIEVLDTDLAGLARTKRDRWRGDHLGIIFQLFNLLPYLDTHDNIVLPCRLSTVRRQRLTRPLDDEVSHLADRLEITPWLRTPVTELSVGQQQRVAAARAMIGGPRLVIADEPTSALDSDRRARFLELLFALCDDVDATLLFVSHDKTLAAHFDRAIDLGAINTV